MQNKYLFNFALNILLIFSVFIFVSNAQKTSKTQIKPNIILINADDLGYGDLGSYKQKFIKTPNLDALAKSGIRFTNFYASAPVCAPSRASLMTGKHQGHAYIRGNNNDAGDRVSLRPEDKTIGEVLKSVGYRTAIIGKWGLGEPETTGIPNKKGFDYFFGYLNQKLAHNYYPDFLWRNEEKIKLAKNTYSHDLFTLEALDFVRRENKNQFFLYLAFTIPHANNELGRKTGNGMEVPTDAPYSDKNWSSQQKNYAAMITRMDTDIGKLLELLRELKIADNTIVIFTSDNGPQDKTEGGYDQNLFNSNGSLRGLKRELYEGGIRESMIVRWNNKIKPNQTSAQIWAQYDLLPTFAEIAGAKPVQDIDGISMLSVLFGGKNPQHKFLYWEFHEGSFAQAVRMNDWKAVRHGFGGVIELYNLKIDPKETKNLAAKHPKIVEKMKEIMEREHIESENWKDNKSSTSEDFEE